MQKNYEYNLLQGLICQASSEWLAWGLVPGDTVNIEPLTTRRALIPITRRSRSTTLPTSPMVMPNGAHCLAAEIESLISISFD